jgi:hypothetical protein
MIPGYEYEPPTDSEIRSERRRYRTPQERYGLDLKGRTCKTCVYLIRRQYGNTYFKCAKGAISCSTVTDIALKDKACSLYEEAGKQ